jgi:hypothetical protein
MTPNVRIASFLAGGGAGTDGFYIKKKGLVGLTGGVGVRRNVVPRAAAHGDFRVPVFRESRFVDISGPCYAESEEKLDEYNRQLTGLMADGGQLPVIFDMPRGPLWAMGELAADPEFDITVWGERADWMLPLYFPNPRLFGEPHVVSQPQGVAAISLNRGNFPATSIFTITGNAPGYTIAGPAGRYRTVNSAVSSNAPHIIDNATGFVTQLGVPLDGTSFGSTWSVPGGGTVAQTITPTSGTLSMTVSTPATTI